MESEMRFRTCCDEFLKYPKNLSRFPFREKYIQACARFIGEQAPCVFHHSADFEITDFDGTS